MAHGAYTSAVLWKQGVKSGPASWPPSVTLSSHSGPAQKVVHVDRGGDEEDEEEEDTDMANDDDDVRSLDGVDATSDSFRPSRRLLVLRG